MSILGMASAVTAIAFTEFVDTVTQDAHDRQIGCCMSASSRTSALSTDWRGGKSFQSLYTVVVPILQNEAPVHKRATTAVHCGGGGRSVRASVSTVSLGEAALETTPGGFWFQRLTGGGVFGVDPPTWESRGLTRNCACTPSGRQYPALARQELEVPESSAAVSNSSPLYQLLQEHEWKEEEPPLVVPGKHANFQTPSGSR